MKKILTVLTMVVFCVGALNLQATDKKSKKSKQNQKAKVNKTVVTNAANVTNALRGQTAVFYADLKKNNKKE